MPRLVAAFCLVGIAAIATESNQASQAAASPAFEVASIRPVGSAGGIPIFGSVGFSPGGQFVSHNVPLVTIVRTAYPNFGAPGQITGGPDWIRTELFDINARAAGNPPRAVLTEMLKQLLADRFKLKMHPDQREIDVYALVLARRDGRLGRGLRRSRVDCTAQEAARAAAMATGAPPPPRAPRKPGEIPECDWGSTITNGVNRFVVGGDSLRRLVAHIQANVGRAVVDRTGLTGQFDIALEHGVPDAPSTTSDPGKAPPLFTAVQEQLGLRLESRKERMDVLVIDEVEMPTPN